MLAKKFRPGSNIVICTDGESNRGFGNLTDHDPLQADFYAELGQLAADSGLTINLIAIINSQCNVQALSKLCEMTGGSVSNVDATKLQKTLTEAI